MSNSIFGNVEIDDYLPTTLPETSSSMEGLTMEDVNVLSQSELLDEELNNWNTSGGKLTYFAAALESIDPAVLDDNDTTVIDFFTDELSDHADLTGLESDDDGVAMRTAKKVLAVLRKGILTVVNWLINNFEKYAEILAKFTRIAAASLTPLKKIPPGVSLEFIANSDFHRLKNEYHAIRKYLTEAGFLSKVRTFPLAQSTVTVTRSSENNSLTVKIEGNSEKKGTKISVKGVADYGRGIVKEINEVNKANNALSRKLRSFNAQKFDKSDDDIKGKVTEARTAFIEVQASKFAVTTITKAYFTELGKISKALSVSAKAHLKSKGE